MKKWICLIAALAMVFSLAACSAKTDGTDTTDVPEVSAAPTDTTDESAGAAEDTQNPIMNFIGNYAADRATLFVEPDGTENAKISVRWSGSAWSYAEWIMNGTLDPDTLVMEYENCVKTEYTYDENGELAEENVVYEDGTGSFTFREDGTITWDDAAEHVADGMVFEYVTVATAP